MSSLNKPGVKDDKDKLMYELIPTSAITGLAEVLTFGAKKYTPNGWRLVSNAVNRYYAAVFRHLIAWRNGESDDSESKLNHLKHVLTNVAFLLELTENGKTLSNNNVKCNECVIYNAHCSNVVKLFNEISNSEYLPKK